MNTTKSWFRFLPKNWSFAFSRAETSREIARWKTSREIDGTNVRDDEPAPESFAMPRKRGASLPSRERTRSWTNTGNYASRREFRRTMLSDVSGILPLRNDSRNRRTTISTTSGHRRSAVVQTKATRSSLACEGHGRKCSYELAAAD